MSKFTKCEKCGGNHFTIDCSPDTEQELFDLCKKVYELTKWEKTGNWIDEYDGKLTIYGVSDNRYGDYVCPLYTSDYLLEKLPYKVDNKFLQVSMGSATAIARYGGVGDARISLMKRADTPLKAILKLTIALHEAGVKL